MPLEPTKIIWMDGEFVPWEDAEVHVLTYTLHYGLGVFEGIRCYSTGDGPAVFRLKDHMGRLENSAKLAKMEVPYSVQELSEASKELVRRNEVEECYIRPIVFYGYGKLGLNPTGSATNVAIAVWPWGSYLGDEAFEKGVRTCISSLRRIHPETLPTKAKLVGNYLNSVLADIEAAEEGYDEAILLNMDGYVAEGSGENLFVAKNNELLTPPITSGILGGITRDSVIQIARDFGISVKEENVTKSQLLESDEAFFTGTAAEITPIIKIDEKKIGNGERGKITEGIQNVFFKAIRGEVPKYERWLDYV